MYFICIRLQTKAFITHTWWIVKTRGRYCCTVQKNRPVPGTCPASYCPETELCRPTCAVMCTTNCPSTGYSSSTRSPWFKTIVVPPWNLCTTAVQKSRQPATRRPPTTSTPCCTTTTNRPKLTPIQINIIFGGLNYRDK